MGGYRHGPEASDQGRGRPSAWRPTSLTAWRRSKVSSAERVVTRSTALTAEVAALREVVLNINHVVTQLQDTVMELNHDVRSGAERSLPLFLGYSERLRLDADTAIGATQLIERQLALLDERLAAASGPGKP